MRIFFKHWENTKEKICFCADFKNNDFFCADVCADFLAKIRTKQIIVFTIRTKTYFFYSVFLMFEKDPHLKKKTHKKVLN